MFDSYDANIDFINKDTELVIESFKKKWWYWENILLRILLSIWNTLSLYLVYCLTL